MLLLARGSMNGDLAGLTSCCLGPVFKFFFRLQLSGEHGVGPRMKVKDPTKRSREAAILDQKVAGMMGNKAYAYIAVPKGKGWGVGIAAEGEHGYNQIQIDGGFHFHKRDEADYFAKGMNAHIGLTPLRAIEIIASSMRRPVPARLAE